MPLSHKIHFRFMGDLNDFLESSRKNRTFPYIIKGCPSVKDTIEAAGVPHVAVDLIFVNGKSVGFSHQLRESDRIKVYPKGLFQKKSRILHLIPSSRRIRFVVDSHLGKLMRHLRLLGFDAVYKNLFPDKEIVECADREKRIVLTRDKGLLKQKKILLGYWVRSSVPQEQIKEVIRYFALHRRARPFRFCLECNGKIKRTSKKNVEARLQPGTKDLFVDFYQCEKCDHVYWKGSHFLKLRSFIDHLNLVEKGQNKGDSGYRRLA